MKLSLCIATYNEAEFIHYPLDSCIDWVSEVVIVDGGSKDQTVQIAKSYGKKVKIIHTDNPPMFHANKQMAIESARGEWILQLDADEQVSQKLKEEILAVISGQSSDVSENKLKTENSQLTTNVAYWLPRSNFFLSKFLKKGGVYPDKTIRLYKQGVAHFPCKNVHENVTVDPTVILSEAERSEAKSKDPNEYIGTLKNDLLHYADPNFTRYLTRWNRYTTLDAQLLKGEKLSFISYFVFKPKWTFFNMYIRHKGFMDGFPGFVFALFSSIRFWVIYIKAWHLRKSD